MRQKIIITLLIGICISACQKKEKIAPISTNNETAVWSIEKLNNRALQQLDSTKWDLKLFQQDIETYNKYAEIFQSYPLNKSPFPVAEYDYAVSSIPFTIQNSTHIFKGIRIGAYEDVESEKIIDKLTLLVLTNDANAEENTLVESRNFPYLTAQGFFKVINNKLDWVFSASPDGFSILLINMKLFDLRFGETVIIYPQKDTSFLYYQIQDSPNNYKNFEDFKGAILNNPKVITQLNSKTNIH